MASSVIEFQARVGEITFAVRVIPRASTTAIAGEHEGALKIRIAAPPVDGAANAELVRFLAKTFKVPRRDVEIASGTNSKNKIIRIRDAGGAVLDRIRHLQ